MSIIEELLSDIPLPKMVKVKQHFHAPELPDVPAAVREALASRDVLSRISSGDRVAIAVGSRGVADLPILTREVVSAVKSVGGNPFIVPAMGSHGGATAEGQTEVLEELGVTESYVGPRSFPAWRLSNWGSWTTGFPFILTSIRTRPTKLLSSTGSNRIPLFGDL